MMKKLLACFSILSVVFSPSVQGDGLIYVATQDTNNLAELYYANVAGSGANITATSPVKISAPQPAGGGVVFAIPNFGNPDEVLYGANQDNPNKLELYIVELAAPGTSTRINAALTADQQIESGVPCADGTKVFYDLRTISTGTLDLYVVSIGNPGVATKLNPNLAAGREVGEFVITPDCTKVIYAAQINSSAEELFVTELSNPGVATKADGTPAGLDHVIRQLSLSVDGSKAFWVGGRSQIGQNQDLLTVSLSDLGNETQVNATLVPGGRVSDFDISPDANSVVYRAKISPIAASNLFFVDLSSGSPGTAAQVNPNWATGGPFLFGLEQVTLLNNGTVAIYDGPRDDPSVSELYETPLNNLQTSTELNAALGTPLSALQGISLFLASRDDSLVMYSDGIGGTSGINVVNRNNPGSAVQPFSAEQGQLLGLLATFNPDSDLIGSIITNLDMQGNPVSSELYVADPTINATDIRVNTDLAAGFGVLFYIWLPDGAPIVTDADTDGDGDPDSTDPDDDNDGITDALDDEPLIANNFCSGGDPQNVAFQQIVSGDLSCAAEVSISVVPTTTVQVSGNLRLIAPTITFQSGFAVAGGLTVISAHPCPACSP
ncbi:MAG: hypothetical protein GY949_17515 [Gammaproteobacteria bacterium]|nr:hypothetical protein [Gammaproteobacteria bacterium]